MFFACAAFCGETEFYEKICFWIRVCSGDSLAMLTLHTCAISFHAPFSQNIIPLLVTLQVLVTAAVIGLAAHYVSRVAGPAALVVGNGLALSSTAVVLQVQ